MEVAVVVSAARPHPRCNRRRVLPRGFVATSERGQVLRSVRRPARVEWQADRGKAQFLRLRVATQVRSFVDTAELWKESRLALPLAESLATSTGDTIIQIEHVRYPLTRMVPMWINVWTYYHRDSSGWRPSLSLWH